ncbi:GNAT family N-acetyltransferase [Chryseolinea sp. H1M3-3]|uniref:GNAT family N-acetyltransferase n=1 Tax=Chryseolinea sp. H1M3-3 TaxID=3034144 RepID=UPI0023EAE589|nr:GNAT family N-acetyltransferase [Chryseolinea sp. H1M3-3]
MQIRSANDSDIPSIVNLLKISLGEAQMPKSVRYWRWKHLDNPFGQSPVLVCYEGSNLIGVRAFMRWEWRKLDKIFKSVRAVDTATHPAHQGKGIFKKLTLALIDNCKAKGDDFVFNTPNSKSKPGYIKMGWQEAGRLPIKFSIQRPFHLLRHVIGNYQVHEVDLQANQINYYLNHPTLQALVGDNRTPHMVTNVSASYLKWRYLKVPVASYIVAGEEKGSLLTGLAIGRIKHTRFGRELRITDCFLKDNASESGLMHQLENYKKTLDIDYCTISGTVPKNIQKIIGIGLKVSMGPTVTIRSVNLPELANLQNFKEWSPSIGDLELF